MSDQSVVKLKAQLREAGRGESVANALFRDKMPSCQNFWQKSRQEVKRVPNIKSSIKRVAIIEERPL